MYRQDVQNIVLAEFSPAAGTANLDSSLHITIFQRYIGENPWKTWKPTQVQLVKPGRSSNRTDHLYFIHTYLYYTIANCQSTSGYPGRTPRNPRRHVCTLLLRMASFKPSPEVAEPRIVGIFTNKHKDLYTLVIKHGKGKSTIYQ